MAFLEIKTPQGNRRVELDTEPITIGRLPDNLVQITDDGLSRNHAVIESYGDGWRLRDLGSRNGTKVNGNRVSECKLSNGDVVRVGAAEIRYINPNEVTSTTPLRPTRPAAARTTRRRSTSTYPKSLPRAFKRATRNAFARSSTRPTKSPSLNTTSRSSITGA